MIVPTNHLIRNASGDYGCPNCWNTQGSAVNPSHDKCPACGVDLEWTDETRRDSAHYKERRPGFPKNV